MNRFVVSLFLASLLTIAPAFAQIPSVTQGAGGQGPTGSTFVTAAIPASSTTITLTDPSAYLTVVNLSSSTTIYFSTVSPATTSNFAIAPNAAYSYSGQPLSAFYVIGSVASGNFSYAAH